MTFREMKENVRHALEVLNKDNFAPLDEICGPYLSDNCASYKPDSRD
jgi:hypothetical protein